MVARPRREVGEGPFLPRRRRRLVERVALGGPTTSPSTRHLLSRTVQRSCSPPPPTPRAPQVDQAIEPALASRPWPGAAGPIYTTSPQSSGQLPRLEGSVLGALEGAALLRPWASPVCAGSTCPRPSARPA